MFKGLQKMSIKALGRGKYFSDYKRLSSLVDIKPEILDALMNKQPVVALESTIITHGMPHPHNLETAISVEKIVREQGAFPATIAILKGRIKIGLTENELAELADPNTKTVKTSRRDFAYVLGQHLNGGTTVAGTIICSELCGIKIFATGGIGGVHRNGETTMDISADLVEMGRSSVAVISSGIKSILDIPRTMEYLETQGVFVSTYQVTDKEFPAFYTRKSGVKAPYNFVDAEDAAKCIRRSHQLGLKSGILIGVPVPDQHAMDESVISKSISNALKEAEHVGIHGKDVTPFILAAISEITAGKSLQTNINLIKNNAKVAAQIAVALGEKPTAFDSDVDSNFPRINNLDNHIPVIVGGSIMDIHYRVLTENLQLNGATYKSETKFSGGGVGRNIAEGLQKLNGAVMLISAFGNDQNGDFLRKTLPDHATVGSQISDTSPTANCAVILDRSGDCKLCAGDMTIHAEITPDVIKRNEKLFIKTPLICIDSNLSIEAMETILLLAKRLHKPVFYEPTDMSLAGKPFKLDRDCYEQIKFISPNLQELRSIAVALKLSSDFDSHSQIEKEFKTVVKEQDDDFREIVELCDALQDRIDNIVVTAGSRGVFVQRRRGRNAFFNSDFIYVNDKMEEKGCRHYPGEPLDQIVNASGAGDAFAAGFIAGMLSHKPEEICVSIGLHAATSALMSTRAVPKTFFDRGHQCWSTPAVFKTLT